MRLIAYQSGQGDSLLLSDQARTARVLVDGGMPAAYRDHVAPEIAKLRKAKKSIDVVYVSHIDEDHIGGVLELLDDEVEWRVHGHQLDNGNATHKAPASPRPPIVGGIWHNAFHEQLADNADAIEDALAASAPVLSGADLKDLREAGLQQRGLISSIRQAIGVSRRIGPKQLGIPLNAPSGGKLMMVRSGQAPIVIGGLTITIIGPMARHLTKLREDWNVWLAKSESALKAIREAAERDEARLATSDVRRILSALRIQAEAFGKPSTVTPPNLASLMLLVEEQGQSVLLTGDGRWDQIIEGLEATGKLTPGQSMNVDVVKVPHHGSEHNIVNTDFLDRVIGTHYVFCGNGESGNPETEVVELMARKRLLQPGKFTFWFTSSPATAEKPALIEHMTAVEQTANTAAKTSKGRMKVKMLRSGNALTVL